MAALELPISQDLLETHNAARRDALQEDYDHLKRRLKRAGIDADKIKARVKHLELATPTWGAGVGGTRFAKFPIPGEPTNINEKLEDCAVVQQLGRNTPRVSPHFPWDWTDDAA